jgi:hypothetical protein
MKAATGSPQGKERILQTESGSTSHKEKSNMVKQCIKFYYSIFI